VSKIIAVYAGNLHKKNSEYLGFIPQSRIDWYQDRGQIIPEYENNELCGYLIWGIGWPWMRIYQACVEYELRWLGHGRGLVDKALRIARKNKCAAITLGCRESNAAVTFWSMLGFVILGERVGGKRRGAKIIQFVLWVDTQGKLF